MFSVHGLSGYKSAWTPLTPDLEHGCYRFATFTSVGRKIPNVFGASQSAGCSRRSVDSLRLIQLLGNGAWPPRALITHDSFWESRWAACFSDLPSAGAGMVSSD